MLKDNTTMSGVRARYRKNPIDDQAQELSSPRARTSCWDSDVDFLTPVTRTLMVEVAFSTGGIELLLSLLDAFAVLRLNQEIEKHVLERIAVVLILLLAEVGEHVEDLSPFLLR